MRSMPTTTIFCDWKDDSLLAHAQRALRYVVETCSVLSNGEVVFVPELDLVVRLRRVHQVSPSCPLGCIVSRRSHKNRKFRVELCVDLRENCVLRKGVPGAQRVYRRLDWHPEDSMGAHTCFVQLNGIATSSWRAYGLGHTVFQLLDPFGPETGACMVVAPNDFMERIEFYE